MSSYYEQSTGEKFVSTAKFPNREENRKEIEEKFNGLLEEDGHPDTVFYSKAGTVLAIGHVRMVYGDHGPYIEFLPQNMVRSAWMTIRTGVGWFDECQPKDGSYCKLYVQKKPVYMLKKPPKGANSCFNNRYAPGEGYADYRPGRLYINPFELGSISMRNPNITQPVGPTLRDINIQLRKNNEAISTRI